MTNDFLPYDPEHDTALNNLSTVQDTAPFGFNGNHSSPQVIISPNLNLQLMNPDYSLQPIQAPNLSSINYSTNSRVVMAKFSFFYKPRNDFQMYHINCEEMQLSFETFSQLINNTENNSTYNIYRK
ncbi:18512_t:CDS:1 [Funneliformis geosporum]|uniref:14460_t:CDS:1 n=1 Tax=Funneliformis geosporum TaxID=1117311 RepID=A0A9W4X230_9GLOM|nr:18512_t:CDS:1 [Funneliformis geosporum]CAI2189553.1 14460_t:CDS:1 [Funneliformis geosporum]